MKKTELKQFNNTSKDLLFWITQYIASKVYRLKLSKGYTDDKKKVGNALKYFDREKSYELITKSEAIESLKDNTNKIAQSMMGLRAYSSPLYSFYAKVSKDKKIRSIQDIDTNYINSYTSLNKLSGNYYKQLRSLFKFIDKNIADDFEFNIGLKRDGSKAKLPVRMSNEKTYNFLEPDDFAKFIGSIKKYKPNHPNPHMTRLMMKFFCFGGLRASEVQQIKINDISFKNISKDKYMQLHINGKGNKKRFVYILYDLLKNDYELYKKVRSEKKHTCKNLFYTRLDEPFSDKRIYDIVKAYYENSELELENFSSHVLRRSQATFLHFKGVDFKTISILLGHDDEESTEFYVFATKQKAREVPNIFEYL